MKKGLYIKSQASMEFIILFGIVLIIFVVFMALTADRLKEATDDRDILAMKVLGDNIRNEVVLATQVKEFYIRRFKLPLTINGKAYKLILGGGSSAPSQDLRIILNPDETEPTKKEYVAFLPVEVTGAFFSKIEEEFLDHCIINDGGKIRISRNQAWIEAVSVNGGNPAFDSQGRLQVLNNQNFIVRINLDCIDEVEGVQFTIKYDQTKLEFNGEPVEVDTSGSGNIWPCAATGDELCYQTSAYTFTGTDPSLYKPGSTFGPIEKVQIPTYGDKWVYSNLIADLDLTYLYPRLFLSFKTEKEADCIDTGGTCNPSDTNDKLNPYQGCSCWDKTTQGILTFGFIHRTGMKDTAQVAEIQFKAIATGEAKIEFLSLTIPGVSALAGKELGGVKRLPETRLPLEIKIE